MRLATVLSAREWEGDLVGHIRSTGFARLIVRAFQPRDISNHASDLDLVIAGAEISWVTAARVTSWKRAGLGVVGVHPHGDEPGRRLFEAAGADEILPDHIGPESMLQAIKYLSPTHGVAGDPAGTVVVVTGPRGAPGCTEVALTLALEWSSDRTVTLIDLDLEAPAIAVRLGISARPDLSDAVDAVRESGILSDDFLHSFEGIRVLVGSHRPAEPPIRRSMTDDVIEAARTTSDIVVVDAGVTDGTDATLQHADHAVLVLDASAIGLVRGSRVISCWAGPPPALVLNRCDPSTSGDAVVAARRWIGLDPAALIPLTEPARSATRRADLPSKRVRRSLGRLQVPK